MPATEDVHVSRFRVVIFTEAFCGILSTVSKYKRHCTHRSACSTGTPKSTAQKGLVDKHYEWPSTQRRMSALSMWFGTRFLSASGCCVLGLATLPAANQAQMAARS